MNIFETMYKNTQVGVSLMQWHIITLYYKGESSVSVLGCLRTVKPQVLGKLIEARRGWRLCTKEAAGWGQCQDGDMLTVQSPGVSILSERGQR